MYVFQTVGTAAIPGGKRTLTKQANRRKYQLSDSVNPKANIG
jgi:hypothetical protein